MPNEKLSQQANAQAIYLRHLVERARTQAENLTQLVFDPQGRILDEVDCDDLLIAESLAELNEGRDPQFTNLKEALGIEPTPFTTVSLDISHLPELHQKFINQVTVFNEISALAENKKATITSFLNDQPKGSIIALQQEFNFHLSLVCRVYQQIAADQLEEKQVGIKTAFQEAMVEVNQLVIQAYAQGLSKAVQKDGKTLDMAVLTQQLDKARKKILPQAHTLLMQKMIEQTGVVLKKEDLTRKIDDPSTGDTLGIKKIAEHTTATANDLLHTDNATKLVTWIAGSENTSHDRKGGPTLADRQIITHFISGDNASVVANASPRLQIRIASPVVKEGFANDQAYIDDVAVKLNYVLGEYDLQNKVTGNNDLLPKAFVYNSYTAFNHTLDDLFMDNRQTQSAVHILRGAHQYNRSQYQADAKDAVFCFVQNISVNGFGDSLGYDQENPLRKETTLMAELALLHTLYDTAAPEEQIKITGVFELYKVYLNNLETSPGKVDPYFSETTAGQEAIQKIQNLKKNWQQSTPLETGNPVKSALIKLIANDLHFTHEYSKLTQAMSVYAEGVSLGGCKSGNERAQAINGRVAVLDMVFNSNINPLPTDLQQLKDQLNKLATSESVVVDAEALKHSLDKVYNNLNLQGAPSLISLGDQGGGAKVEAKGLVVTSTNQAEENTLVMTNLHQNKAAAMQAHKALTEFMVGVWDGHPQSLTSKIRSGKITAAFRAVLANPLSLLLEPYRIFKDAQNQAKTKKLQMVARDSYFKDHPLGGDSHTVLSAQIGQYKPREGSSPISNHDFVSARITPEVKKELYAGVDEYYTNHAKMIQNYQEHYGIAAGSADDPQYFRKAFIALVESGQFKDFTGDDSIRATSPEKALTKLKDFFGKKGAVLYKLALQEEMNSQEYRDAVFQQSTKYYEGSKWVKRLVLIFAGPSASGKSFLAGTAVPKAAEQFIETLEGNEDGNYVVSVDGGVSREVSQMRKLAIQAANNSGYCGIEDLHGKSSVLSGMREIMLNTALASDLGVVIPETFSKLFNPAEEVRQSDDKIRNLMSRIERLEDKTVQVFARIEGENESIFQQVVHFMGSRRAWKTTDFTDKKPYSLNADTSESKKYPPGGFRFGYMGSILAERWYKKQSKNKHCLIIVNDLILLKPQGDDWVAAKRDDEGAALFSKAVVEQWKSLDSDPRPDLTSYNKRYSKIQIYSSKVMDNIKTINSNSIHLESELKGFVPLLKKALDTDPSQLYNMIIQKKTKEECQQMRSHFIKVLDDFNAISQKLYSNQQQLSDFLDASDQIHPDDKIKIEQLCGETKEALSTIDKNITDLASVEVKINHILKVIDIAEHRRGKIIFNRSDITCRGCLKLDTPPEMASVDTNLTSISHSEEVRIPYSIEEISAESVFVYDVTHQQGGKIYSGRFTEEYPSLGVSKDTEKDSGLPKARFEIQQFPQPIKGESEDAPELVAARVKFSLMAAHEILASMEKPATEKIPLTLRGADGVEARYLWTALLLLDEKNPIKKVSFNTVKVYCSDFNVAKEKGVMFKFNSDSLYHKVFKNPIHQELVSQQFADFKQRVTLHKSESLPAPVADLSSIKQRLGFIRSKSDDAATDTESNTTNSGKSMGSV